MLTLNSGVTIPPAGSASPTAVRRLQKDYAKLMEDPIDGIVALPNEDNILEWHYCIRGSPDTPFEGGYYWGKVIFKENFPWSPPALTMITPNGRFATNVRLCLSISDYHPESWNPGWTVSAILIGLHSFMNENKPAAGSISGTPQQQKDLAMASKEFNVKYREFRRFFPDHVEAWTGVRPHADEPDVAPTMLPEHATPEGVVVPTVTHRAPIDQLRQMREYLDAQNQQNRQAMQNLENRYPGLGAGPLNYPPPIPHPHLPAPYLVQPHPPHHPPQQPQPQQQQPLRYHEYFAMAAAAAAANGGVAPVVVIPPPMPPGEVPVVAPEQPPPPPEPLPMNVAAARPRRQRGAEQVGVDGPADRRAAARMARIGMAEQEAPRQIRLAARRGAAAPPQQQQAAEAPAPKRTRRGPNVDPNPIVLD